MATSNRPRTGQTGRPAGRYGDPAGIRDLRAQAAGFLQRPGWVLLPLRVFLGVTFTFAGLQKLADPHFFDPHRPSSIQGQLALFRHTSPIGALLGPISHHAVAFGILTALAEIAVGVGTLLGLWARVAALGGLLLATSFFLTVSFHSRPYYYGADIFVMVMWLPFIAIGAGGVLSLDAVLRRRAAHSLRVEPDGPLTEGQRRELDRRTLLQGSAAAGAVGVGALAVAGIDAGLGRALVKGRRSAASAAPPASAGPTTPAASKGPTSSAASGIVVGRAADVPVGGALAFTIPSTEQPAYVVQPRQGSFEAFSAICSHAGCTVGYDTSQRIFVCPCHGSTFDGTTGAVQGGPAPTGLTRISVTVSSGQLRVQA